MSVSLAQQLENKRAELKELNEAIDKRKAYYREQEELINDLIEQGNTKLMELTHDVLVAKKELRELKTDIRTGSQDKVILMRDLRQLRVQVGIVIAQ